MTKAMSPLPERFSIVGHCKHCDIPMVSEHAWRYLSPDAREGRSKHAGFGYCVRDLSRVKRHGAPIVVGPRKTGPTGPDQVAVHQCMECGTTMVHQRYRVEWPELAEKHVAYGGQGWCKPCYRKAQPDRSNRSADEVLDDWAMIRDDGCTDLDLAASRMGMTKAGLYQALYRARKKGDPRGSMTPFGHDMRRAA